MPLYNKLYPPPIGGLGGLVRWTGSLDWIGRWVYEMGNELYYTGWSFLELGRGKELFLGGGDWLHVGWYIERF